MQWYIVMACLIFVFSSFSKASSLQYTFNPQVTIFKKSHSNVIEIDAKKVNFSIPYNSEKQAFHPLDIPFVVRAVKGKPITYNLTLQVSEHYCIDNGKNKSLNHSVSTLLDGKSFPHVNSGEDGSNGLLIENKVEQSHKLSLIFDNGSLPQLSKQQSCYGLLGINAGIEL
ncbi:hypothetical protein CTN03_21905 [Photobacterium angustum]|nr:hypothetical protein UB39_21275 [Photobacterium angustum]PSW76381.1 hypothetical protein CTN03_21905 [Photobacterium angustum]